MLLDSTTLGWKFVLPDETFTQHPSFKEDLSKAHVSHLLYFYYK